MKQQDNSASLGGLQMAKLPAACECPRCLQRYLGDGSQLCIDCEVEYARELEAEYAREMKAEAKRAEIYAEMRRDVFGDPWD